MYCHKCGTDNGNDVNFCKKCGESLNKGTGASTISEEKPMKKKSKKKLFIIIGIIMVIIVGVAITANWGDDIDYVATVQIHTPFANSQGINLTYATVFNKYLESIKWETRKVGDIGYVDISGKVKGNGYELLVTISVTPTEHNDVVTIILISAKFNGERIIDNDAVEFLLFMFYAYDNGYDNLDDYFEENIEYTNNENIPLNSDSINLSETYTNDEERFFEAVMDSDTITNPTVASDDLIASTPSVSTEVPLKEIALNTVKNGTFVEYPDKPIAETIEKYFNNDEYMYSLEDSEWITFYDDDGDLIIRNTITYLSYRVMEEIVFEFLYFDDDTFILYSVRSGEYIYDKSAYINEIFNDSNISILGEWYDSIYANKVDTEYASRIIFNEDGSLVLIANLLHGMLELTGTYHVANESWIRCYVETEFASDSYGGYFSLYVDNGNTLHYTDENGGSIGEISEHTTFIRK